MSDKQIFKDYLARIERACKAGNATEHTHRPALKTLLETFQSGVTATNEPKRIECGAPDYIVSRGITPVGYVEAKDVGANLDEIEDSVQLKRYRASLRNLILTDYLEFRLYLNGEHMQTARLAKFQKNGVLRTETDGAAQLENLLKFFSESEVTTIASPKELARRMAMLGRMIHDVINLALAHAGEHDDLLGQYDAFRQVLLHDLSHGEFADMYAQTICYGLFAARCNHNPEAKAEEPSGWRGVWGEDARFTRKSAGSELPKTNPFLRKLFNNIAGADLDERIAWAVDDLAELLARTDTAAILRDFGHATRQHDPVVHFYETFLAAYDPKLREMRGVYYTPEPVVDYIVRSVDAILKRDFKLAAGLADHSRITLKRPKQRGKGEESYQTHRVQILDPACGTGTFLYAVVARIREHFAGSPGLWPGYVAEHLLPRIFGFELLMAPYAVAHMKLGLQLKESGYGFASEERLRVFLTNTLEEAHELAGLPLFANYIAQEAMSAGEVKRDAPIMVVLGNPPYSGHSANTGEWIAGLLRGMDSATQQKTGNYFEVDGQPLGERNPKWLNDDYVKFIRFAQWRIEKTGYGVLAFVTNHGYLDNPTFRGMRQSLMQSFDDIYLLNLHGNSKKKERSPDGGKDENVFDIQQGVAIGVFVKRAPSPQPLSRKERGSDSLLPPGEGLGMKECLVHHADLYGLRNAKYAGLAENDVFSTLWKRLQPQAPFYLFVPQDEGLRAEYEQGWKITDIMPVNVLGFQSHRDGFAIDFDHEQLHKRIAEMRHAELSDAEFAQRYDLKDGGGWKLNTARKQLRDDIHWKDKLIQCSYRPFDTRWAYFSEVAMDRPRRELKENVAGKQNLCLNVVRQTKAVQWQHAVVTDKPAPAVFVEIKDGSTLFPLYLYSNGKSDLFDESAPGQHRPNFAPEFIADFASRLKLEFVRDGCGDLKKTFGPEDVFHYAYAVFHSPAYRSRYAEFLKIDFPRLPLTRDVKLFQSLCALGRELVELHLMEGAPSPQPSPGGRGSLDVRYPITGDNTVDNVHYTGDAPQAPLQTAGEGSRGRVWINKTQYFGNVPPEVWSYHAGGYQVCQKWLKDRKGRQLSYDELTHYRGIVAALARTIELQAAIDESIGGWPVQ